VALFDFFVDGVEVVCSEDGARECREGECGGAYEAGGYGGVEKCAAIDGIPGLRFFDGVVRCGGFLVQHDSP